MTGDPTKTAYLVVSPDVPAFKAAIAAAAARAVNEASASLRMIRDWCDSAEQIVCSHESEMECRRSEAIKDCSRAVRALLPDLPPSAEGGSGDEQRQRPVTT